MDNHHVDADTVCDLAVSVSEIRCVNENAAPFVILPNGYAIHDLEKTLPEPIRKRGTVTMNDSSSFIDYVNVHGLPGQIYGQVNPPKFVAVLNDHQSCEPGWRDHKALYNCPVSKEWEEWKKHAGTPRDQITFSEFIESNIPDIISNAPDEPTGAMMLEVALDFRAQKKVNFATGQRLDNGQVNFVFQEEIQGSAGAKGQIKVPEKFFIAIPVFEGGSPYKIECKLRYRLKDGSLSMWFDLVRDHKVLEAAFMEIWKEIEKGTDRRIWRGVPE